MSLIIILLAVFNNFTIWRPYLLSQAPHIIARPPQSRKRGYAPDYYGRPDVIGQAIILLPCGCYIFSSPNLSGRRLDVYHTSTHGVALVRIYNAGLKSAVRGSLEIQDAKLMQKIAICAPSHNFVRLYLRN